VKEALRACGVDEIHDGIGKTGVVGVIRGQRGQRPHGRPARRHGCAADDRDNDFAWKSARTGLMHGCGHDGHTAMLVGAARYLAETRNFDGTAVLIFQPGEEGFAGARVMIEDGLFDRFPVQSVYGMHNWPRCRPAPLASTRRDDGSGRPRHHRDHRQGRPWRARLPDGRPGAGGGAHHHCGAEHRLAQRAAHRQRRRQPVRDAGRRPRRHERDPRQGGAGGHRAHLHAACRTWSSAA
jgi:hypothetical protein